MIVLRNFKEEDAEELIRYKGGTLEEIKEMFSEWNKKEYKNKYYEMFAVTNGQNIIGNISLYHHSENVISCGPEIFIRYRKQGFAKEAMEKAMEKSKEMGYKIVFQQIRVDNTASIALHKSLGFETDGYIYKNKKGNEVLIYLKILE